MFAFEKHIRGPEGAPLAHEVATESVIVVVRRTLLYAYKGYLLPRDGSPLVVLQVA